MQGRSRTTNEIVALKEIHLDAEEGTAEVEAVEAVAEDDGVARFADVGEDVRVAHEGIDVVLWFFEVGGRRGGSGEVLLWLWTLNGA